MTISAKSAGFPDDVVLAAIQSGRARTRNDVIRVTGLSRSTVSHRVEALVASGVVVAAPERTPTGGRPAAILRFNGSARLVFAADLGAIKSHLALVDLSGRIVVDVVTPWDIAQGPGPTLSWLRSQFVDLRATLPGSEGSADLAGVGVGLPGPVEAETGRPSSPPIMPGWDGAPVRQLLSDEFGVPASVDNDVNVAALGHWIMRERVEPDLIFVKVATGIGAGIISNGVLLQGAQGSAGDIGHIPLASGADVICLCGNFGCLEAVASGRALAARLTAQGIPTADGAEVAAHVRAGVGPAVAAVREAGRAIGQVLAAVVNVLNPSTIVIGGSLAGAADPLLAGIREIVYQRCPPLATKALIIESAAPESTAGVVGVACRVLGRV